MNLDLLKKLARLANNNPNDNEANLAARRVCKMLEEFTLNFKNSLTIPGEKKIQELKVDPVPKSNTWENIYRNEEAHFTNKPPEYTRPFTSDFEDLLHTLFGGRRAGKTESQREPFVYNPTQKQRDFYTGVDWDKQPSSTQWNKETAPIKICERCKKEYKSPRTINVCADCQWKEEFERNNKTAST